VIVTAINTSINEDSGWPEPIFSGAQKLNNNIICFSQDISVISHNYQHLELKWIHNRTTPVHICYPIVSDFLSAAIVCDGRPCL
jgi:hypothetical protein